MRYYPPIPARLFQALRPACRTSSPHCLALRSQPKRYKTTPRKAPLTRRKQNAAQFSPPVSEGDELILPPETQAALVDFLQNDWKLGRTRTAPEVMLLLASRTPEQARAMIKEGTATYDDMYIVARYLLRMKSFNLDNRGEAYSHNVELKEKGQKMLELAADDGHVDSVVRVVYDALRQDADKPGVLKTPLARRLEGVLHLIISREAHVQAIGLAGQLAAYRGDVRTAIRHLERATNLAIEEHRLALQDKKDKETVGGKKTYKMNDEEIAAQFAYGGDLSSPWNVLGRLCLQQGRLEDAGKAYLVGMALDDPTSFFYAAQLDYYLAGKQYNQDWVYNMTKAAASGHHQAAYELGVYYLEFAPPVLPGVEKTLWGHVQDVYNNLYSFLRPQITAPDATDNKFHLATWPRDIKDRLKLGEAWLHIAVEYQYMPARLAVARLALQPYIGLGNNLTRPITRSGQEADPPEGMIKNPYYWPNVAADQLSIILGLRLTVEFAQREPDRVGFEQRTLAFSPYPEVWETWVEDLDALEEEARQICDVAGIDAMDLDGTLLYRYRGPRGDGLFEVK